ncbi:hypothetical protein NBRC116599_16970 [Aquicoccus sp. SU-CL01552]
MSARGLEWPFAAQGAKGRDAHGGVSQSRGCLARSTVATGPNQPLVTKLVAAARLPETAIRRERGTEVPAKVNSTQGSLYAEA